VTGMRARVAVLLILAVSCAATACSSAIAPRTWATSVCDALTPWRAQITTLNQNAQVQMAATHTPAETRTHILALLAGAERATEKARVAVVAAGVPDVDGGAVIEKRFVAALAAVRDAYKRAETSISSLPTTDAGAFYDGVGTAMTKLNADYAKSGVDTNQLASTELQADFDKVAACR
jgi:hypothetical protein